MVRTARDVIEQENVTRLSKRDRAAFVALLDDKEAHPNKALTAAARKCKDGRG